MTTPPTDVKRVLRDLRKFRQDQEKVLAQVNQEVQARIERLRDGSA